jgi:flagellar biosynthesis protein FlhB
MNDINSWTSLLSVTELGGLDRKVFMNLQNDRESVEHVIVTFYTILETALPHMLMCFTRSLALSWLMVAMNLSKDKAPVDPEKISSSAIVATTISMPNVQCTLRALLPR